MRRFTERKVLIYTPIFIVLAHVITVFAHAYAHSFVAWILGYKTNPFAINYGGYNLINIFLQSHVHGQVDYGIIRQVTQMYYVDVAVIALAGPIFANGFLFLFSLVLLRKEVVRRSPVWFYFIFWLNLMNLGSLYDYVPIRTFAAQGDIANVVQGLGVSPWFIYVIFGYPIAIFIWHFFVETLIQTYMVINLTPLILKVSLMVLCVLTLFGFFGSSGFIAGDPISHFLAATSLLIMPGWIIAAWPTRAWVQRQMAIPKLHRFGVDNH